MNAVQLSLLPDAFSPLDDAIARIRSLGSRHNNYVRLVRMAATSAMGQRPGSVVLCAALSDYDAAEICTDISQFIQESLEKHADPAGGVCIIETPHALRAREMRSALVEAYHDAGGLFCSRQWTGSRCNLDGAPAYLGQNHAQRVATLLRHREPRFYLFKNIHLLQRIDSQPADALEFIRMLARIASSCERTHILLGDARTVLRWMKTKEIAEIVAPVVLEPYDLAVDADKTHFLQILAGYDEELPWEGDDRLAPNFEYIHRVVGGSPHRVRRWILNALCRARAYAQAKMTWNCFVEARPTATESEQAVLEFDLVREFLGKPKAPPAPRQELPKQKYPPGTRALGRDAYAA